MENQGIFLEIKMFKSINNFLLLILIIIFSIGYIIFFLDADTIKSEIEEYVSSKINNTSSTIFSSHLIFFNL